MIIKLIYILYLIHTQTNGVSVEMAVEVVAGLTTQFNLDGAYLLMLPEQENNVWWIQMGRELIKRNIPTAVMNYEETTAIEIDLFWFPICVIYSQGMYTTPALKEVKEMENFISTMFYFIRHRRDKFYEYVDSSEPE